MAALVETEERYQFSFRAVKKNLSVRQIEGFSKSIAKSSEKFKNKMPLKEKDLDNNKSYKIQYLI